MLDQCLDDCNIMEEIVDRFREGKVSEVSSFDWEVVENMAESTAWMVAKELGAQSKEALDKGPTG